MKLYIRGNYTSVIKEIDPDRFRVIIKSGHGEETFISFNRQKLVTLSEQIEKVLEEED